MPNRIVKESICTSETLDELTWFEECFWYRLMVNCDDYGRFDARLPILKSRLFPLKGNLTDKSIGAALSSLATAGLVTLYEFEGKPFLQLTTWEKHQQIRAKKSKYPANTGICYQLKSDDSKCPRNPIQSESNPNPESEYEVPPLPPKGQDRFADFWQAYPKKQGKGAAEKTFSKIKPSQQLLDKMLLSIKWQKQSQQWQKDGGQFIPNPATWLNQRRWEDEQDKVGGDDDGKPRYGNYI